MIPKNRIRLSRSLHAQTTPYPEAKKWVASGFFLIIVILAGGIYMVARPRSSAEQPQSAQKQILGEQEKAPEYLAYVVKKGDTLFNLSQRYELSWQTLAQINNLQEPYILKVGQKLKVPASPPGGPQK